MKIEIKNRWTDEVLYATEVDDADPQPIRTALERAILAGASLDRASLAGASLDRASLDGASLDGANLARANLGGAILDGANLGGAYLVDASLVGASLAGASLDRASLVGAILAGASLDRASLVGARLDRASLVGASLDRASLDRAILAGASLVGASLGGANLDGANLDGANLVGARLDRASLDGIRNDMRRVLDRAPAEVSGLLAKLRAGEVDGSCYEGSCACLVGTIANIRGVKFNALDGIVPDARSPAEKWFTGIGKGSTPENNPVAAITEDWILEWQAERGEGDWITLADGGGS